MGNWELAQSMGYDRERETGLESTWAQTIPSFWQNEAID
jgi:hypothetical protein